MKRLFALLGLAGLLGVLSLAGFGPPPPQDYGSPDARVCVRTSEGWGPFRIPKRRCTTMAELQSGEPNWRRRGEVPRGPTVAD